MDKLIHGQGHQYAQQDTSKYFDKFVTENTFDLLMIDRIIELQSLQCFQIADQLLCKLYISACIIAYISGIIDHNKAENAGNCEQGGIELMSVSPHIVQSAFCALCHIIITQNQKRYDIISMMK